MSTADRAAANAGGWPAVARPATLTEFLSSVFGIASKARLATKSVATDEPVRMVEINVPVEADVVAWAKAFFEPVREIHRPNTTAPIKVVTIKSGEWTARVSLALSPTTSGGTPT